MKDVEKGWLERLRKTNENLQCHMELKERLALSERFSIMTSDLETFPDAFFSVHLLSQMDI